MALPDFVFDFHDQPSPHHARSPRMAGDLRPYGLTPRGTGQILRVDRIAGQVQPPNELAGSLHVRGRKYSSTRLLLYTGVVLVLASQSPRRAEILRLAGIPFTVRAASVDETARPGEGPEEYVCRLAEEKTMAVAAEATETVLGADTTVVVDSHMLAKPDDEADARRMLQILSGRCHEVLTGICLRRGGRLIRDYARTRVWFSTMTTDEIAAYVDSGEPMDKAGGYAIQGLASKYIEKIEGCYFNVMGLPVALVYGHIKGL